MAYDPPKFKNEIDLYLSANESCCPIEDLGAELADQVDIVSRYPDHQPLQESIGKWIGVDSDRIVVTAGGDDAIDRVMRHSITKSRTKIVCHQPSFEMIRIYTDMYNGELDATTWLDGDFPFDDFVSRIDNNTAIVVLVTPNNPTGGFVSAEQILQIADAASKFGARLLLDNAYIEFADEDPTSQLISNPNISIVRTFSKAIGLAGMRIGYLIAGDVEYATSQLRFVGNGSQSHRKLPRPHGSQCGSDQTRTRPAGSDYRALRRHDDSIAGQFSLCRI
jgi:histidinol-phosphate aminotransferase